MFGYLWRHWMVPKHYSGRPIKYRKERQFYDQSRRHATLHLQMKAKGKGVSRYRNFLNQIRQKGK